MVAQRQQEEADRLAQEAAARAEAARQAREADDAAYAAAQRVDTAAAYGAYLAAYPTGRYAAEARARQQERAETERLAQETTAREADEAAYAEARRVDTAASYGAYLAAYPTGRRAAEARAHQQARAEEAERLAQLPRELRNSVGMEFVSIAPGTFEMGSPSDEPGRDEDETLHRVTLSQPLYVGKTEVTQDQWEAVMGDNPSNFSSCGGTCPVEGVSWEDAQGFIAELNRREGVSVYRLPTEAEWEYAARAGTQTAYHFGNAANQLEQYGWYEDNARNRTHPVGQKQPNGWGLFDMHGNVWEWVHDWYGDYPGGAVTDPRGPEAGAGRVYRGGSWISSTRNCRAANRVRFPPGSRYLNLGFRLARTS